jgi:ABC-type transport system involved in multi-copper enzyme maturation permease subunit
MLTTALDTIREVSRRKFAPAAMALTALVTVLTAWGFWSLTHLHTANGHPLSFVEVRSTTSFLVIFGAFLFSFVLAFGGAILSTPLLSTDLESGLLLPVLSRPISRVSFVAGKAAALIFVVGIYCAVAGLLQLFAVRVTTGYVPPHPFAAVGALWMLATVVMAFGLALSVRLPALASSLIAVAVFGVSWMVGVVSSFGIAYHNAMLIRLGVVSQLLVPTDAMWRIAVYQLEPVAMLGHNGGFGPLGPFSVVSPPPIAMVWWTLAWIAIFLTAAAGAFSRRDA